MTDLRQCEICKAQNKFNGQNGNGYQPVSRPVPPYIEPPRIEIIEDSNEDLISCDWFAWVFGICIGIGIGFQLSKFF
ncbi:hypothetical protein [Acinetobacter sp. ANC 5045]|uniref:hypothetical protein n=1 Tax=Acinetobacter sp. ANC 5045 TaxID=2529851 RepID=UPI0010400052|nr:hypothetical protein [Acinetobacter sp. ANC 5045]TCB18989.1 hypothetical protein E0H79_05785 [Acinetobacter sp. ANC 5045]